MCILSIMKDMLFYEARYLYGNNARAMVKARHEMFSHRLRLHDEPSAAQRGFN